MNASLAWLSAFVDSGLTATEMRDLITGRVATVDAVESLRTDLASLVVGQVVTAARHPDSDHLWVTTVDAGGDAAVEVICGAPNVQVGVKYPFAPVGTVMPGGLKIERRKIRGQVSSGMLCSARELQLGTDHEGILPLDTDAKPGTPLLDALPLGDSRLVIDVLPNRADLLSQRGLAREIAAAVERPLLVPHPPAQIPSPSPSGTGTVTVAVEHAEDAPTYLAIVLEGLRLGPSPDWLRARLEAVGVRSINNVVDITNYMLHGYGQPMHAFDLDMLSGGITVRRARRGERLVTLDGVERTLDESMVVIADDARAQALAGVMGGRDSEVTERTTRIVLEVASFSGHRVRKTSRSLGLSSDASYRYERGVPPELPLDVAAIAIGLFQSLAGARVVGAPTLAGGQPTPARTFVLRGARVERLLGIAILATDVGRLLAAVGFEVRLDGQDVVISPPWFRPDVTREADLLEEVARLYGYDRFPSELRAYRPTTTVDAPLVAVADRVREAMAGLGLLEARPIPFVADAGPDGVRVHNPLADTEAFLRSDLLTPLARRAEYNLRRMTGDVRLFEIGTVFKKGEARPIEEVHAAVLIMGKRRPPHFTEPEPPAFDEWDAKGVAQRLARTVFPSGKIDLEPALWGSEVLWHIHINGNAQGSVRRVPLDAPPWAAAAYGVEMTIETTATQAVAAPGQNAYSRVSMSGRSALPMVVSRATGYVTPPAFPAVERDVTLLVPDDLTGGAAAVERVLIEAEKGALLEPPVRVISEYRGPGVPPGVRAVTWRLTFRHPTRTLTEKEVDASQRKLLRTLETELGVRQRTA